MLSWLVGGGPTEAKAKEKAKAETPVSEHASTMTPPTPPVLLRQPWPGSAMKPKEGTWVVREVDLSLASKGDKKALTVEWRIADTGEGIELLMGLVTAALSPASPEVAPQVPRPELISPTWMALHGDGAVTWLEKIDDGTHYALHQTAEQCNGSNQGTRYVMHNEAAMEAGQGTGGEQPLVDYENDKQFATNAIGSRPARQPWYVSEEDAGDAPPPNDSLPLALRMLPLYRTCQAWIVTQGWLAPINTTHWITLYKRVLYVSLHQHSKDHDIARYDLTATVVVKPAPLIIAPDRTVHHPLVVNLGEGKQISMAFYDEAERDLWAALIDVAACQASATRKCPKGRATTYEYIIGRTNTGPSAPPVNPDVLPDESPEACRGAGYLILQADSGWFHEGWKRRWVTIHDTWFTFRTHRKDTASIVAVPLRNTRLRRAPQPTNPYVFALYNPFEPPINVWCDSVQAFSKYLALFDKATRRANSWAQTPPEVTNVPPTVMNTTDLTLENAAVTNHGIKQQCVFDFQYAKNSPWRHLETDSGLIGCEDGEVVAGETGLVWKDGDTERPGPLHVVVRGKAYDDEPKNGKVVMDCHVPETAMDLSRLSGLGLGPKIVTCLLSVLPPGSEHTPSCRETDHWLAVIKGTLRVLLFPGACYSLMAPGYPATRSSTITTSIPAAYGASSSPIRDFTPRHITLEAGQAIFIQLDHFHTVKALSRAEIVRCLCAKP